LAPFFGRACSANIFRAAGEISILANILYRVKAAGFVCETSIKGDALFFDKTIGAEWIASETSPGVTTIQEVLYGQVDVWFGCIASDFNAI